MSGSKVLIFSQLKGTLDIIQEYCSKYGYDYERLDGDVSGPDRETRFVTNKSPSTLINILLIFN
jgi:SNF2 family DNA or RNA helicase